MEVDDYVITDCVFVFSGVDEASRLHMAKMLQSIQRYITPRSLFHLIRTRRLLHHALFQDMPRLIRLRLFHFIQFFLPLFIIALRLGRRHAVHMDGSRWWRHSLLHAEQCLLLRPRVSIPGILLLLRLFRCTRYMFSLTFKCRSRKLTFNSTRLDVVNTIEKRRALDRIQRLRHSRSCKRI